MTPRGMREIAAAFFAAQQRAARSSLFSGSQYSLLKEILQIGFKMAVATKWTTDSLYTFTMLGQLMAAPQGKALIYALMQLREWIIILNKEPHMSKFLLVSAILASLFAVSSAFA